MDKFWDGGAAPAGLDGVFSDRANWNTVLAPDATDVAHFGVSSPPSPFQFVYTVNFSANATTNSLLIEDDLVTFDLNGNTYTNSHSPFTIATQIGNQSGRLGKLTVTHGFLDINSGLFVGIAGGSGNITVNDFGTILSEDFARFGASGSSATINLDGTFGASWSHSGEVSVGWGGTATMNITSGGSFQNNKGIIADGPSSGPGTVMVSGNNSRWTNLSDLIVGNGGNATLNINSGASVESAAGHVSFVAGHTGTVTVDGLASRWNNSSSLFVGDLGTGIMNVTAGGGVQSAGGAVGAAAGSSGTVSISGAALSSSSFWLNSGDLNIGGSGSGTIDVTNMGVVRTDNGFIGRDAGSTGTAIVNGNGSQWKSTSSFQVGVSGHGTVNVTDGAHLDTGNAVIGVDSGSIGEVMIDGVGSTWTNTGLIFVSSFAPGTGTLTVTNGGVVSSQGGISVRLLGTLRGNGQIIGNVSNIGVVAPGTSPGALHVTGNFTQGPTGTLKMDLAGTAAGTQYDQLLVSGAATLAGTLDVSLTGGFVPTSGMSFDILDGLSLTGTFDTLNLPALAPGLNWDVSQLYVTGVLSVGLAGDFNNNAKVDAADYVVWRKGLGTIYTQNDYNLWRTHFGQTAGSGSAASARTAVPEPATVIQISLVAAIWCPWQRRRAGKVSKLISA